MNCDVAAFETSVRDSLKNLLLKCGCRDFEKVRIGVAVSGGADSMCLLSALVGDCEQFRGISDTLVCITVDHSIRPNKEGAADAEFVEAFCAKMGIRCVVKKIPEGAVFKAAAARARGIEEAARFLRYEAFEEAAAQTGAEFICLAHNKNDALETLLMRFLQGSAAAGMSPVRGRYVRPLLQFGREEIEAYLREKKIAWRTDSTNSNETYLRNKIRLKLIPFLKEQFPGFENAVFRGSEKLSLQSAAVKSFALNCEDELFSENSSRTEIAFDIKKLATLPIAVRQELIYGALTRLGVESRVPYGFVRTVSLCPESDFKKTDSSGVSARTENGRLFLKIGEKQATESGFFAIIEREGVFDFGGFSLEVCEGKNRADADLYEISVRGKDCVRLEMQLPFVVRTSEIGDAVVSASGAETSLADFFSDRKIPACDRKKIPVLECGFPARISAVLGCVLGYENWIAARRPAAAF